LARKSPTLPATAACALQPARSFNCLSAFQGAVGARVTWSGVRRAARRPPDRFRLGTVGQEKRPTRQAERSKRPAPGPFFASTAVAAAMRSRPRRKSYRVALPGRLRGRNDPPRRAAGAEPSDDLLEGAGGHGVVSRRRRGMSSCQSPSLQQWASQEVPLWAGRLGSGGVRRWERRWKGGGAPCGKWYRRHSLQRRREQVARSR